MKIIGKCGKCGGTVSVPTFFYSMIPPTPQCMSCGTTVESNLPILKMKEKPSKSP